MDETDLREDEIPKWDIALAALAREEHDKLGKPLHLQDFQRLAGEYAIRLDDIMVTMFQLVIHGEWEYRDAAGGLAPLTQETLDGLFVNRRLREEDLRGFAGAWTPV